MAHSVIGIFDNTSDAQRAIEKLVDNDFSRSSIDISDRNDSGYSGSSSDSMDNAGNVIPDRHRNTSGTYTEEVADDTKDAGDSISNFFSSLFGGGNDRDNDDYRNYSEVGRRGSVVAVHVQSSEEAERAADILDDCGAIDVNERASQYRSGTSNTNSFANTDTDTSNTDFNRTTADFDQGTTDRAIPIVEENLQVGKREVETGGVRLRSRIVERPVEEHVRLRTEHVTVNRNPVDRPASEADLNTFKEGEITLTERAEVPVVNKESRVVEEVSLNKSVEEREEVVRDSVRKTEVDVEQLGNRDTHVTDQSYRTDNLSTTDSGNTYRNDDSLRNDNTNQNDDAFGTNRDYSSDNPTTRRTTDNF